MGNSTLIDIVGSTFIGLFLLLSAMRMNENAHANNFQTQENLTVQQNLVTLVQLLERDFRRIGYRRGGDPPPDSCILYGRRDSVVFVGDIADDGSLDTVTWYSPDTSKFTKALRNRWNCSNKFVRMLIRTDRNPGHLPYITTDTLVFGVTQFSLRYYDTFKHLIVDTSYGKADTAAYRYPSLPPPVLMQVSLEVQPLLAYGADSTAYQNNFAFWSETRLVSRNLTAR